MASGEWETVSPAVWSQKTVESGTISQTYLAQGEDGRNWLQDNILNARQARLMEQHQIAPSAPSAVAESSSEGNFKKKPGGDDQRPVCPYIIHNAQTNTGTYGYYWSNAQGEVTNCTGDYVGSDAYAYVGSSNGQNGYFDYEQNSGFGSAVSWAYVSSNGPAPCYFADSYVNDGDFVYYKKKTSGICSFDGSPGVP